MNRLLPMLALLGILVCWPAAAAAGDFGPLKTEAGEMVGRGFVVGSQGQVIGYVDRDHNGPVMLHVGEQKVQLSPRRIHGPLTLWAPLDAADAANLKPFEITRQSFLRPRMQADILALQSGGDPLKVTGTFVGEEGRGAAARGLIGSLPPGAVKAGSPLLNACGQIDGVVIVDDALLARRATIAEDRATHALAYPVDALRSALSVEAQGWRVADQDCREQRLQAQTLNAEDEAAAARRSAGVAEQGRAEADRRAQDAENQRELAEERARLEEEKRKEEERRAEEERLKREAEEKARREAEEKARQEAQAQRRMLWIIAAASAAALLLGTVLLIRRQRQRRFAEQQRALAEEKARQMQAVLAHKVAEEQGRQAVPDVLLSGSLPDGWKLALTIPASALLADGGVLVGRNPPPPGLVINHEEVSRRHLRLRWNKDHVEVEDVGSTNGTMVDGEELKAGDRAPLTDGVQLQLGELSLGVRLRYATV